MGHPLAPAIMQRFSTAVARYLHLKFHTTMVAYLDDWLFFSMSKIPVPDILEAIQRLGITINKKKSVLQPTTSLIYLGLQTDTTRRTTTPTAALRPAPVRPRFSSPCRISHGSPANSRLYCLACIRNGMAYVPRNLGV
jgi:hypothetical protein